jgi:hypothetical protein
MSVGHALHQAEHVAHSKHHGHHESGDRFGTYIGVTMAILGVLLAICSALVGSERTHLVEKLVAQQNAHAKYQAQDVKHRVAFISLSQLHATAFVAEKPALVKEDILYLAQAVKRYLIESRAAKDWTNSYDAIISSHLKNQEHFEYALLLSEIGIVIASIALLMRSRPAWILSLMLGGVCVFITVNTLIQAKGVGAKAAIEIAAAQAKYEELRKQNKTTDTEEVLVNAVFEWAQKAER